MNDHDNDSKLQLRASAALRQADDHLPAQVQARLTAIRQQVKRDAQLAADDRGQGNRRQWLLWSGGALTAACLLALLLLPQTTPPEVSLPLAVLPEQDNFAIDMQLLLDDDFALLADAHAALDSDETLAFYAWVGAVDADQNDISSDSSDAMESGS